MQRYFINKEHWQTGYIKIQDKNDVHHMTNVMRMQVGDQIICVQPNGKSAICQIKEMTSTYINVKMINEVDHDRELPVQVTIAQGLPKRNKLEFILQKGTELGCHQFALYQADRSIVKWDDKKGRPKLDRYHKIVKEASEQCGRHIIPTVTAPVLLENLLKKNDQYDLVLFAYEEEAKTNAYQSIHSQLQTCQPGDRIFICIGPEGGFSEEEAALLEKYGAKPVRIGSRILRTETASMYVLASISYHFEEMGH